MPKHVWMMWLMAGGGTLVGATLMYLATRTALAPAGIQIGSRWRRWRNVMPTALFKRRKGEARSRSDVSTTGYRYDLPSTGNAAFDEYRDTQLAALEHEAKEFRNFLQRLRDARDREEFDAYLRDKKSTAPVVIDNDPLPQTR